jgi:hypothetical protein
MPIRDIVITEEMKRIGALILFNEFGAQFIPDHIEEEVIVESIFIAMLSAASKPEC